MRPFQRDPTMGSLLSISGPPRPWWAHMRYPWFMLVEALGTILCRPRTRLTQVVSTMVQKGQVGATTVNTLFKKCCNIEHNLNTFWNTHFEHFSSIEHIVQPRMMECVQCSENIKECCSPYVTNALIGPLLYLSTQAPPECIPNYLFIYFFQSRPMSCSYREQHHLPTPFFW